MKKLIILLLVIIPGLGYSQNCNLFIGAPRDSINLFVDIVQNVTKVNLEHLDEKSDSTVKTYFLGDGVGFTEVKVYMNLKTSLNGTQVIKKQEGIQWIEVTSSTEYINLLNERIKKLFNSCQDYGKVYIKIRFEGTKQGVELSSLSIAKSSW